MLVFFFVVVGLFLFVFVFTVVFVVFLVGDFFVREFAFFDLIFLNNFNPNILFFPRFDNRLRHRIPKCNRFY